MSPVKVTLEELDLTKKLIRLNIETDRSVLEEFEVEKCQIIDVLERVIKFGESDSVLVIGPSGCGKSCLVEQCISDVLNKFGEDSCKIVKLNGLIHVDDNLAIEEIITTLQIDNIPDGGMVTGSFAGNLTFVLQSFKSGNREVSKPVVFFMDEFEYFCEHKSQTLLYNLFDVAQSAQTPVCIFGITSRIDITEQFEKRVLSRFSQRQIPIYPNTDYKCKLKLLASIFTLKDSAETKGISKSFKTQWNESIKDLLSDLSLVKLIRRTVECDPNLKLFKNIMYTFIAYCNQNHPLLDGKDFERALSLFQSDRKVALVKDLSVLEVCLIIAMKHQNEIHDCEPMNFDMVFRRYMKFAVSSSTNVVEPSVVYKAFERLKELELIVLLRGARTKTRIKESLLYSFVLTDEQVKAALSSYGPLPTDILQWSSSSMSSV